MRFEPTISWLPAQYSNHYTTKPSLKICVNHIDLIQKVQKIHFWQMKCFVMKLIWYLPTWGQKCTQREVQQILFGKFDLGHPLVLDFSTLCTAVWQCGNFKSFSSLRFFVKSMLQVQNLPFLNTYLESLKFGFYKFLPFLKAEVYHINKIHSPKKGKLAVFEILDSPNLISRKISMTEKSWHFHTVCTLYLPKYAQCHE